MARLKKKMTKEDKLAKDRQRKKEKYEIIKNNPELYAIQREKERKRYLLRKEQKKICSIKEMTPRAQREQRKKWRSNSLKYLKKKKEEQKIERILLENSPPASDIEMTENVSVEDRMEERDPLMLQNRLPQPSRKIINTKLHIRRLRYKHNKIVQQLKAEIQTLKADIKKRTSEPKNKNIEDSIEKRVDELVTDVQSDKREEIKKKLIFTEAVSKNLKEEYKTLQKKNKKTFMGRIVKNRDQMKKYQVLNLVPFPCRTSTQRPKIQNALPEKIITFLEDDSNSSIAAGKKEYVKCKGIKHQKRYLRDNIVRLHEKFCKEEEKVGYSTFCRYRPAWVISPNKRDTCLCKLHSNVDLIIESLKKAAITKEGSSAEILKSICCKETDENCLDRACPKCNNKVINYQEFSNEAKIEYHQWLTEKQSYKGKQGEEKTTNVTIKKKLEEYPRNIINNFEETTLPKFMMHTKNIALQYASIKKLKKALKEDEIIIHIDFSENYSLKYNAEIQSFHFGGSRGQISLHTGVLYYKDRPKEKPDSKSFCTVSKCLRHDAASVWAHLIPVIDMAKEIVPSLKVIHFLSDSPTSQYRNRFIFYMMTKLNKHVPGIQRVTWNYLEAGHGKGAPDGIGAVVKQAADNFVMHGGDVDSFENFVQIISQRVTNVKLMIIEEEIILQSKFPRNIPTFKGTMNVHQALWCRTLPHTVAFRKLSCFECESSYVPCHHHRHLGVLSIGIDSTHTTLETETLNTGGSHNVERLNNEVASLVSLSDNDVTEIPKFYEKSTDQKLPILDNTYDLNLDSPTIQDIINIDDAALLDQIDDQTFLETSKIASPNTTINETPETAINKATESPKVTILSNVKFDWQNHKFYLKTRAFHQSGQDEFRKFLSDTTASDANFFTDKDKRVDDNMELNIGQTSENEENKKNSTGTHVNDNMELNQGQTSENCENMENNTDSHVDDNMELNQGQTSENEENKENIPYQRQGHKVGDWVIVQYQVKTQVYAYIGQIQDCSDRTCYTIHFLKKSSFKTKNTFSWPTIVDEDTVSESRIFSSLSMPDINRRGQYCFKNLPNLKFK